jgi:monoamine oxidase
MGSVFKCMAVYDKPFWREQGLSGNATSDTGPVKLTYDNAPPDGSPGVLLGFIEGQEARDYAGTKQSDRRDAVIDSFARYFGEEARKPKDYIDKSWAADRWSRGCYVGYCPPGVLVGYRESIRSPVGPIHWAGTETATEWAGYMDGAVESGERAADEVLNEI